MRVTVEAIRGAGGIGVAIQRQGEEAGIDLVAVERRHVAAEAVVVGARLDRRFDRVALATEQVDRHLDVATLVEPQEPIQGDPAEDL